MLAGAALLCEAAGKVPAARVISPLASPANGDGRGAYVVGGIRIVGGGDQEATGTEGHEARFCSVAAGKGICQAAHFDLDGGTGIEGQCADVAVEGAAKDVRRSDHGSLDRASALAGGDHG